MSSQARFMNQPKKTLGQHWLKDASVLGKIIETAEINPGDVVLEIGPGQGSLTKFLLATGARVTAVEYDQELFNYLKKYSPELTKIELDNLKLINQDILKFDLSQLPSDYKVVANIPYYLTSNLIRILCESANPPVTITLLVQKELARRLCAKPGQMSLLSVSAQAYHRASLGIVVPAAKFIPPPKVDSQVVHLKRRPKPLFGDQDRQQFFRIVKAGFSSRRKTLENSLSGGLNLPKHEIQKTLLSCQINPAGRPQELSLEQWVSLSRKLATTT